MDYAATYARFPLPKLLDVLDRPGDYHPETVAVVRKELQKRKITGEYIAAELKRRHFERKQIERNRSTIDGQRALLPHNEELLDSIIPALPVLTSREKRVFRVSAFILGFISFSCLYWLTPYFGYLGTGQIQAPAVLIALSATLLIGGLGCFLLLFLRKEGWYLVVSHLVFSLLSIWIIYGVFHYENAGTDSDVLFLIITITLSLLGLGVFNLLWRRSVRNYFEVTTTGSYIPFITGVGLAVSNWLLALY